MSAIKDKIQWYQYLVDANREKGIIDASLERDLDVTKEISDRLDALDKINNKQSEIDKQIIEVFEKAKEHRDELQKHIDALEAKAHEHHYDVLHNHITPDGVMYLSPSDKPDPLLSAKHDTERSCRNCNLLVGCKVVLSSGQDCCDFWEQYVPRPKQPAQERLTGRADGLCPKCMKPIGATTLCPFCGEHFEPYTQEQGRDADCCNCLYKDNCPFSNQRGTQKAYLCDKSKNWKPDYAMLVKERDDLRARLEQAEAKVNELTAELEKQKASAFETGELALKRGFEIERMEKENAELKRKLSEVKP